MKKNFYGQQTILKQQQNVFEMNPFSMQNASEKQSHNYLFIAFVSSFFVLFNIKTNFFLNIAHVSLKLVGQSQGFWNIR